MNLRHCEGVEFIIEEMVNDMYKCSLPRYKNVVAFVPVEEFIPEHQKSLKFALKHRGGMCGHVLMLNMGHIILTISKDMIWNMDCDEDCIEDFHETKDPTEIRERITILTDAIAESDDPTYEKRIKFLENVLEMT